MLSPSSLTGDASEAMGSFGENLRREREMRGVNLEEISATTRISVRFLQALEGNDFAALPGGVFTRSFIRAYASYLGLDQEAVMAEFQTLAQSDEKPDFNRLGTNRPSHDSRGWSPVLLWTVAAALLAGGWALYRYSHRAAELQASRAASAMTSSAPAVPPPQAANPDAPPAMQSTTVPAGARGGVSNQRTPPNGPGAGTAAGTNPPVALSSPGPASSKPVGALGEGDLVLQVTATEHVWLAVSADGKKVFQKALDPNAVETFRAADSFDVTTGNAQGTVLTLNGEPQKPLGRHGELKTLHLTRQSLQNP